MKTPSKMREIRFRRGLTLDEVGLRTGLDLGWLSRAERGLVPISPANRAKISVALNFPIEALFPESESGK